MFVYILKRTSIAVPTLLAIIALSFFLMRFAPGGPFDRERPLQPEIRAALEARYGLDDPVFVQFWRYMANLAQGDFGPSYIRPGWQVMDFIAAGFPVSFELAAWALLLAVSVGIPLGAVAALRSNSRLDVALMSAAMTGIAVPRFVLAPLLSLFFGVYLGLVPVGGWHGGAIANKILPVLALALPVLAYVARITRGAMIETLHSEFITVARAKGMPARRILFRHAIKPVLIPVISFLGPGAAGLISGSVVIERVFGLPGMGSYFVDGALNRDYLLVLGVICVYAAILVTLNLVVDLAYAVLDPRTRSELA